MLVYQEVEALQSLKPLCLCDGYKLCTYLYDHFMFYKPQDFQYHAIDCMDHNTTLPYWHVTEKSGKSW